MAKIPKYETAIAVTIQFVIMTVLNFINGTYSSINQCVANHGNCSSNIVLALVYFLLISFWFGALWLAGMAAQEKRSPLISKLLIAAEVLMLLVSIFDLVHNNPSLLSRFINLVDGGLSLWVAILAYRLLKAKGGRVRPRNRINHSSGGSSSD
jgi:hypothetical protein